MLRSTVEAGEPVQGNPVEGRGHRDRDPLEGKASGTQNPGSVGTKLQRIAGLAKRRCYVGGCRMGRFCASLAKWLNKYSHELRKAWWKWLNRRSQRASMTWEVYLSMLKRNPLPKATAVHSVYHAANL